MNWNGTFTANYRIGTAHTFTLNHVISTFKRTNTLLRGRKILKSPALIFLKSQEKTSPDYLTG